MSMFGFRIHKCFMQQRARDSKIHIKSTTKRKNKKTNNRIDSFVLQNDWDAIIVLTQSIFDSHQMTVKNEHVWLQNSRMFYATITWILLLWWNIILKYRWLIEVNLGSRIKTIWVLCSTNSAAVSLLHSHTRSISLDQKWLTCVRR